MNEEREDDDTELAEGGEEGGCERPPAAELLEKGLAEHEAVGRGEDRAGDFENTVRGDTESDETYAFGKGDQSAHKAEDKTVEDDKKHGSDAEKCAKDHGEEGLCGICAEDEKEKRHFIEGADALFDIPEDRVEEF